MSIVTALHRYISVTMDLGRTKRTQAARENVGAVKEDLKDFEEMRRQVTDIISNKVFKKGIISLEDRELLRKLLREIKHVIHDIETVPDNTFDLVSKQKLTNNKAHTRRKYQKLIYAFNNDESIETALKDAGTNDQSFLDTIDPHDQANINHGFESDRRSAKFEDYEETVSINSKTVLRIENRIDGSYSSASSKGDNKKQHRVLNYNKPDLYGGSLNYFMDDYEAASTISVSSGDNWTLRKSSLSIGTDHNDDFRQSGMDSRFEENKVSSNGTQKNWKPASSDYEERKSMTSSLNKELYHERDKSDINDFSGTVPSSTADEHYDEAIVDGVLGDFDYLNEYQSQSDASNVSLCGSEASVKTAENSNQIDHQNRKAGAFDTEEHNDDSHRDKKSVNDLFGVFDYLNEYHSRTNSTSTASLYDSNDDIDLDAKVTSGPQNVDKSKDSEYITDKTQSEHNIRSVRKDICDDQVTIENKVSEYLLDKSSAYGNQTTDVEPKPDYENESMWPVDSKRYDFAKYRQFENISNDKKEKSVLKEKTNINIAYGIEDKGVSAFRDKQPAYESNRSANKDGRSKTMLDKARSEEVVSGYTHGEFILRRTKSEDQNGAFRPKSISSLEVVPENTYPTLVYDDNVEYARKGNPDTGRFDKCDFLVKLTMVILFGIGVSEIILGIVYREDCNWEETVPICTITSGGVSICYCGIFLGINMIRKRTVKMARYFRALMVVTWLLLLGMIVAGGVLLYPSIKDYAFSDCTGEQDCCRRRLILISFCAIIIDFVCQICFAIGICCVH